jgi:uncharacterized membrane protein
MDCAPVVVHWLHVLLSVMWFGGQLSLKLLIEPALRDLPESARAQFYESMMPRGKPIFVTVITGVGGAGILRGTVFGPVTSLEFLFGTACGLTFLAAIAFGLLAFYRAKPAWMMRLRADDIGFFGAFTAMILMHFGL